MSKNDLFRRVAARSPDTVERLITLWGSGELPVYVGDMLNAAKAGSRPELVGDLAWVLEQLLTLHRNEFPQFDGEVARVVDGALAGNLHFQVVQARFPRVAQKLAANWGQAAFSEYANELLNDKRSGVRQGFPEDVALAIFRLVQEHDLAFPQFVLKVTDIWVVTNAN